MSTNGCAESIISSRQEDKAWVSERPELGKKKESAPSQIILLPSSPNPRKSTAPPCHPLLSAQAAWDGAIRIHVYDHSIWLLLRPTFDRPYHYHRYLVFRVQLVWGAKTQHIPQPQDGRAFLRAPLRWNLCVVGQRVISLWSQQFPEHSLERAWTLQSGTAPLLVMIPLARVQSGVRPERRRVTIRAHRERSACRVKKMKTKSNAEESFARWRSDEGIRQKWCAGKLSTLISANLDSTPITRGWSSAL